MTCIATVVRYISRPFFICLKLEKVITVRSLSHITIKMQSNHQSTLHKSGHQLQWEDFEKRVWKYYEHLWYEVVYHWFEKWLKDWWIDLIVKKLSEKTKYVQCKNLKKQIDYDKIAWIFWIFSLNIVFNNKKGFASSKTLCFSIF